MAGGGVGEAAALQALVAAMTTAAETAPIAAAAAAPAIAAPAAAAIGGTGAGLAGLGGIGTGEAAMPYGLDFMLSQAATGLPGPLTEAGPLPLTAATKNPNYLKALLYANSAMNNMPKEQNPPGMAGHGPMSRNPIPLPKQPPTASELLAMKRKLSELLGGGMV
jgi:hypothetical protein